METIPLLIHKLFSMKYYLSVASLLLIRLIAPGQLLNQQDAKTGNDPFCKLLMSIDGEFIGQIAFIEKKDLSGTVLFKTEGGILQIRINGVVNRDARNDVTVRLHATQIKDNEFDITAMIGKKAVRYRLAETGFGLYKDTDIAKSEYKIITILRLTADGYPDYFLEFPVIVKITPVGNIDDMQSYISDNPEHFIFYKFLEQLKIEFL